MADTLPSDSVWADALAALDAVPPPEMPECCVCMEMTLELTPCKHSLCSGCKGQIVPLVQNRERITKCPVCRAVITRVGPPAPPARPAAPEPPAAYQEEHRAWLARRDARIARARAYHAARAPGPPPAFPDLRIRNAEGRRVDIPVDFWARLAANGIQPNYERYASRSYAVRKALDIARIATTTSYVEGGRTIRITDATLIADVRRIVLAAWQGNSR